MDENRFVVDGMMPRRFQAAFGAVRGQRVPTLRKSVLVRATPIFYACVVSGCLGMDNAGA